MTSHNFPVLVDRSLLIFLSAWYGIFFLWGAVSVFVGVVSVDIVAGPDLATWYALGIALVSAVLLPLPVWNTKVTEIAEKFITPLWMALVVIYPISLIWRLFTEFNDDLLPLSVLSLALLAPSTWRFTFLIRKHLKSK